MPRKVAMLYNPSTLQHLVKRVGDPDSAAKFMPPSLVNSEGCFVRLAAMCKEMPGDWVFADGRNPRPGGPRYTAVIQ